MLLPKLNAKRPTQIIQNKPKNQNMKKYMLYLLPMIFIVMTSSILSDNGKSGRTGSPGETTCVNCHGDFAANTGGGSITITNVGMTNWQYTPGQTYPITVTVARTGSSIFGLGLECLTAANANAGTLAITNAASTQIKTATVSGVVRNNIVHTLNGGLTANTKSFTFNWTAPPAGTGTVKFYYAGIAGDNDGGESGDYVYNSSKTVTELSCTTPATPGTISGTANNNCGVSTKTYSIAAVAGATSYVWRTDIVGATLNGLTGNVTTTVPNVSLKFPANFVNAKIYVKAQNACGASAEKFKTLSSKPAVPTVITGPVNPCTNATNVAYSISPVSGATSYSWTIPSTGMTQVSGQGTTNLLVNTKATAVLCSLKVGSTNACGTSTKRVLPVTLVSCIRSYELVHNGLYLLNQPRQIEIYTIDGRRVASFDRPQENTFTPELSAGLYIFSLRYDDRTENQKVMVQ
jgi:large repetitive protein